MMLGICKNAQCAVVVIGLIVFQMIGLPSNSNAQWPDRSDELPGMMSTGDLLKLTAVAVAVVVLIVIISKSSGNKTKEAETEKMGELEFLLESLEARTMDMQNSVPIIVFCSSDRGISSLGLGLEFKF